MAGRERPVFKIPTRNPQLVLAGAAAARGGTAVGVAACSGTVAPAPGGREVVVTPEGITVYPPRWAGDRWRAVWREPDGPRRQCQAVTEGRLAAKLEPVAERLAADAPNMQRTGTELIGFYLSPDRLPPDRQWSRRHAETQRYLCARFVAPVIGELACQDIKVAHLQSVVNGAPTAVLGDKVRGCVSALVGAGIAGGYLANGRLRQVHWQAGGRPAGGQRARVAGETVLYVDPGEIPGPGDVEALGAAVGRRWWVYGLMVCLAAYSGLRWGELASLTAGQIDTAGRQVVVDRKVVEVRGHLYTEAPKCRKCRRTIYPRRTPAGYPLAERVAQRAAEAGREQAAGGNPLGLMFPAPGGGHWRSSNFGRRFLAPAYLAARWRGSGAVGGGRWTWHSLRHVFCTTALFTWGLDAADVSRLAGHATTRTTLDMYVGTTAGALTRAARATD